LEDGDDWDRKRAWDWTAEESAAWDKKLAKKKAHRDNVAFQDFGQDANKIYKRQVRDMNPDVSNYEAEKMAAVERAAQSGGLEIVETEDGELIAVDKDGSFYSTKDSTDFVGNKPSKEKIDKLVGEIQKAEEVRLKKRKERSGKEEDGDVTYINDKNKQVSLTAKKESGLKSMLTLCDYSLTKNWRGSTTSTPRRSETALKGVLLSECLIIGIRYSTLSLHMSRRRHRRGHRSTQGRRYPVLIAKIEKPKGEVQLCSERAEMQQNMLLLPSEHHKQLVSPSLYHDGAKNRTAISYTRKKRPSPTSSRTSSKRISTQQ